MQLKITRVEPLRLANIVALVYGLMMTFFVILAAPFLLLGVMGAIVGAGEEGVLGFLAVGGLMILYPIMGGVMGWISGLIGGFGFNLAAKWIGGLMITAEGDGLS